MVFALQKSMLLNDSAMFWHIFEGKMNDSGSTAMITDLRIIFFCLYQREN